MPHVIETGQALSKLVAGKFQATGQDSYTRPPAQNEELFERVLNAMPPMRGIFSRRWGISPLGISLESAPLRLYEYQNTNTFERDIIAVQALRVLRCDEDFSAFDIVQEYDTSDDQDPLRACMSRNFGYFSDGTRTFKYSPTQGTSNWGIAAPTTGGSFTATSIDNTCPAGPGTIALAKDSPTVTGTSTTFKTTFQAADPIYINGTVMTIGSIQSDTQMTLTANWDLTSVSGASYKYGGVVLSLGRAYYMVFGNSRTRHYSDLSPVCTGSASGAGSTIPATVNVFVGGMAMPWSPTLNPSYNYGDNNGTAPVSVAIPAEWVGKNIVVTWKSGLVHFRDGSPDADGNGSSKNVTGQLTGGDGMRYPTYYMGDTQLGLGGLCGAFADNSGTVIQPIAIGNTWTFTVPVGATKLLLGIDDNDFHDNSGGFNVQVSFQASITPIPTNTTGPLVFGSASFTDLAVSTDPQVDVKIILATQDNGDSTTLYELAQIPNSQTTFTDRVSEVALLEANTYLETDSTGTEYGCTGNQPVPYGGLFPTKFGNRLALITDQQYLRVSKSLEEVTTGSGMVAGRWEECWPADYEVDISTGAEEVRGMVSNGTTLFIGTEKNVHSMTGTSPADYTPPERAFANVGVANQDVWHTVYLEGTPVGMMWLTPDNRVILSDFSTYTDVGEAIQDQLNTINAAAIKKAFAFCVTQAPFSLFVLCVPTGAATACNTAFVYDLRYKKWVVWTLPTGLTLASGLHHVTKEGQLEILLGSATDGYVHVMQASNLTDNGTNIPTTLRTSWLGSNITLRKVLNDLEVLTDDPNLKVTIEGATKSAEFDSPNAVVSNAALVLDPFGQYKVFLANLTTKDKFYRLTFSSNGSATSPHVLAGYALEFCPLNNL